MKKLDDVKSKIKLLEKKITNENLYFVVQKKDKNII